MPLDRIVLLLVVVVAAAAITVWLGALAVSLGHIPGLGLGVLAVAALVGYVLVRVVADRMRSEEDDRYDRIEK